MIRILCVVLAFIVIVANGILQVGCSSDTMGNDNILDEITLSSGERKVYSVNMTSPVHIGIICVEEPQGGLIEMQQIGGASRMATSYWTSKSWQFTGKTFNFEVVNNASNSVTIKIFIGNTPPE